MMVWKITEFGKLWKKLKKRVILGYGGQIPNYLSENTEYIKLISLD
jgi:hypothetical protein